MEANLKSRLITAGIGIPFLLALVGWGPGWLFAALILAITAVGLAEFFAMAFAGRPAEQILGVLFGLALSTWVFLPAPARLEPLIGLWLVLLFAGAALMPGALDVKLSRASWILFGGWYLGYLLPHWVSLFRLPEGRAWVFFVLAVVMVGDSAAYFVGRRYGRRKLAMELSPGKTVEGACGYIAGSVIAGGASAGLLFSQPRPVELMLLAAALGLLGQIGDLFESLIKRVFAVKDSGALFPGHGGLLDRVDSLIFPVVFTTAYLGAFQS